MDGMDVVKRYSRVLQRCQGKEGWDLIECIHLTLMGYAKSLGEIPDDVRIWFELYYIGKQLQIQEETHEEINKSVDLIRGLGYPQDSIEKILEEFNKPIGERNLDVLVDHFIY